MAKVNAPPQKVPEQIKGKNPELFSYLEEVQFFFYQLWRRTSIGGSQSRTGNDSQSSASGDDLILRTANEVNSITNTVTNIINNVTDESVLLNSLLLPELSHPFTCDDTGFTCDSDLFSTDMTET